MATTVNTLETYTEVFKGDRVVADGVERSLGDVTPTAGLVSSTDPFEDGSLISKWQLDGTTTDLLTVNDLTQSLGALTWTTGLFGKQSGVFSGGNKLTGTPSDGNNYSYSVWIKPTAISGDGYSAVFEIHGFMFMINASWASTAGRCVVGHRGAYATYLQREFDALTLGVWTNIVITKVSDSSFIIYKDGVAVTSYTSVAIGGTATTNYTFGGDASAGYYIGEMQQIESYNKILTPTEVYTLYTQTSTKYTADFNTPLASIPTSVYRLDHDNLTIDGTPTDTTATVLDSRAGLIASGDTVLLDGVGVVCDPVVEGTEAVTVANDEFETVLYEGNGGTKTVPMANITGGVDFVWLKARSASYRHMIYDSIRGVGNRLEPHNTNAEFDELDNELYEFNNSSFSVNAVGSQETNYSGATFVAWCASLPNHTPSNTAGTITSETKSNSFMSVVSYTGNLTADQSIGHSLGAIPELIITKNRDIGTYGWMTTGSIVGVDKYLRLETSVASTLLAGYFPESTSSVINLGAIEGTVNGLNNKMIAYAFTSVAGKCKVGSYTGTGAAGNAIDCGFEPAWVMIKRTDSTGNWVINDSARSASNRDLWANSSTDELGASPAGIQYTTTGFTIDVDALTNDYNASGGTYIYLAIAKDVVTTTPKYDLTYPTQTAPTRIALSGNDIVPTVASDTFDGTDTFTKTYNKVTKTARDVEYGFVADDNVEIVQLNLNQNMEP